MAAANSYSVAVEFVTGSYTDITAYVSQFVIAGKVADILNPLSPCTLELELDNNDLRFTPNNGASPYAGNILPGKGIKVADHIPLTSTASPAVVDSLHIMFRGKVDEWAVDARLPRRAIVSARDITVPLFESTITTSLMADASVTSAYAAIMTAAGIAAADFTHKPATANDILPFAWFDNVTGAAALQKLLEAGDHQAYFSFPEIESSSRFTLRPRRSLHTGYWSLPEIADASLSHQKDGIFNSAIIQSQPKGVTSQATLSYIVDPIPITASGFVSFEVEYLTADTRERTLATSMVTPVKSVDWKLFTGSDGTGTNLTATASLSIDFFSQTAVSTLFNGTGTAGYLTTFRIRGSPIVERPQLIATEQNSSSQSIYGIRKLSIDNDLVGGQIHAQGYASHVASCYSINDIDLEVVAINQYSSLSTLRLTDVLRITDPAVNSVMSIASSNVYGSTSLFMLWGIEHTVTMQPGLRHEMKMGLKRLVNGPVDPVNLVANPGFEFTDGLYPWTAVGSCSISFGTAGADGSVPPYGKKCLRVTFQGSGGVEAYAKYTIPNANVEPGTGYTLSADHHKIVDGRPLTDNITARMEIIETGGATADESVVSAQLLLDSQSFWVRNGNSGTVGRPDRTGAYIKIVVNAQPPGGDGNWVSGYSMTVDGIKANYTAVDSAYRNYESIW